MARRLEVLRVDGLCVKAGTFQLKDITFHVPKGQYTALLGPTGTGKTLLLETIVGLRKVTSGTIRLESKNITQVPPEHRSMGIVYQDYALFPHLTVFENIAFGLKIKRKDKGTIKTSVKEIASFLEIDHLLNRKPANLSGGERQRVALARALVLSPKLLLLDEPLAALDRPTRERIRRELKRIHKELSITILHITHDIQEAFFLGQYLVIMKHGEIVQKGRPGEILARPANRFVADLLGIPNIIECELLASRSLSVPGIGFFVNKGISGLPDSGRCKGYIAIQTWAVEIFPLDNKGMYCWKGTMEISQITPFDGQVRVELKTKTNDTSFISVLSQRELRQYPELRIGNLVPVGILKQGVRWMNE